MNTQEFRTSVYNILFVCMFLCCEKFKIKNALDGFYEYESFTVRCIHYVLAVLYTYRCHPTGVQLSETEYLNFGLLNQTVLTFFRIVIIITLRLRITFLGNCVRI